MSRALKPYTARITAQLSDHIPNFVASENGLIGTARDSHQAEFVVQHLMTKILAPLLPSPEHIVQNKTVLLRQKPLKNCIPDIIITNVDDSYWGFFELKTLLQEDQLNVQTIDADLEKLCAYKVAYPNAAAIFVLVGSEDKLFNPQRSAAWANLRIKYGGTVFTSRKPRAQRLDAHFVAMPCGSSGRKSDVQIYMWEILPNKYPRVLQSSAFRFEAKMA